MSKYVNLRKPGIVLIVLVIISAFLCLGNSVSGQSSAKIQNIQFAAHNDTLTVTYDIIHAERKELFDISLIDKGTKEIVDHGYCWDSVK